LAAVSLPDPINPVIPMIIKNAPLGAF